MNDRTMLATSGALRERGIDVVRFNFYYTEKGSRRPDPMAQLRERFEAVVTDARKHLGERRLIIGGRSMGGRVATMLAADGFACDALLLFAYPLHPAGQPRSCAMHISRASACRCSASTARAMRSAAAT